MSVLALPTYRQRPVSAPSMNYDASLVRSESSSPDEVHPLLDREALLAAWPKRSALVVEEIIVTEKNYVESLHEVVMGYLKPLYGFLLSVAEGPNFIETVFSNIMRLQQINMELFNKFLRHYSCPREFGNVFVNFVSHFMQYTDYCTNFPYSEELLQKTLKADPETRGFIMDCQLQVGHALPLITYLHKPVQRILKYRLLLEEVLKGYPQNMEGHQEIKCALETMSKVAKEINEKTRQMENRKRVENIQKSVRVKHKQWSRADLLSYGNLITEESCKLLGRKGGERQMLLFEKTVLFLSKKGAEKYKYKDHVMVEELDLSEVTNSPTVFKIFSHYSTSKHFTVQVRNSRVKEELICKFRSVLESHLEQENNKMQQEEGEKEQEMESSSVEDSTSFGDSDNSLSETKIVARQRSRAFKSKELQWRRREQASTRRSLDRYSMLPAIAFSEGEASEDHLSLSESMSSGTLTKEREEDSATKQDEKENASRQIEEGGLPRKEDEDDKPRPSKVIKLQRRSAVRYKRGAQSLGRSMTFAAQGSNRYTTHKQWSLDMLENDDDQEEETARYRQESSETEETESVSESGSTSVIHTQSSLDRGLRNTSAPRLVRQPQITESLSGQSLTGKNESEKQQLITKTSSTGQLPATKSQTSWLHPVIEEAPPMEVEDDEDEGEDEEAGEEPEGQDDHLVVESSLRTDLRLKWTQERLEELRKDDVSSFVTLPRKRKGEDSSKDNTHPKNLAKQHSFAILDLSDIPPVDKQDEQAKPLSPTLQEDKAASSLPARGLVLNRISMYENLSKMCDDNQATYNSIPQLRNRRPFSVKVGGQAVPSTLLQRTKKTSMAHTVYTSNPTQGLATQSKAVDIVPQQTNDLAPSPSTDADVPGTPKLADRDVYAFDVSSPQSSAPESMQYDSGVASDTNSPIGAPSSPSVRQSSAAGCLTNRVEHVVTQSSFNGKKNEQTITEKLAPDRATTPTLEMPELISVRVQLAGADSPPEKTEARKKVDLDVDTISAATVSSSTTALPGNGAITGKPGVGSTKNSASPTHKAAASGKRVPSKIETTIKPPGLRERKPVSHLATSAKTPGVHAHPADSSSTGVKSERSVLSASLKSQGAQIALSVAISISVISLPYPYHTVMMGLLILAVCIFFFIVTLSYHTFGKNFFTN